MTVKKRILKGVYYGAFLALGMLGFDYLTDTPHDIYKSLWYFFGFGGSMMLFEYIRDRRKKKKDTLAQ